MIEALILSLVLTLLLELPYALLWGIGKKNVPLLILMNVLTNPLVVLWNRCFLAYGFLLSTVLPEVAAVVAEAFLICRYGKEIRRPVLLAICINVFSYFAGMLLQFLF